MDLICNKIDRQKIKPFIKRPKISVSGPDVAVVPFAISFSDFNFKTLFPVMFA